MERRGKRAHGRLAEVYSARLRDLRVHAFLERVADDPNLIFEAQDASGGTPLTIDDIGLNINVVVGAGSTVSGQSGMELNNATEATDLALDLKLTGFVNAPDNAVGEHAKYFVRINRHRYANQIVGV